MDGEKVTIGLLDICNSKNPQMLKSKILETPGQDIELDATDIDFIPTLVLQTMLAASKQWQADNKHVSTINLKSSVIKDIQMLGLENSPLFAEVAK